MSSWCAAALLAASVAGLVQPAGGIRCWGANAAAIQRARGAAASCTAGADRFDLFRYDSRREPCFEECGGVTWFEGHSTGGQHFANPTGKRLCPGVVDKGECVASRGTRAARGASPLPPRRRPVPDAPALTRARPAGVLTQV